MVPVVRLKATLAAFVAFAVVASVAACGPRNGGDVKPADYAKRVCSTLLTWRQAVASDSARLSRRLQARSLDVGAVKARYTEFFQAVVGRTDALLTQINAAGAPRVNNGVDYSRGLLTALRQARAGLADARVRFARLPATDLRSYAAGAATIRDQLGRVFLAVGAALDRLSRTNTDKSLNRAFDQQSECRSLA
jgi:3-deoxy-D-arabino-heptulosonate 7-phosphate (DAHP) synthase